MAFSALGQSLGVGRERYQRQLQERNSGETVQSLENRFANVRVSTRITPQGNIPSNCLTTNQPLTFHITRNDTLAIRDGRHINVVLKPTNTHATNSISTTWAEALFNTHSGIEWLMDGQPIESMPMMQAVLSPIEHEEITEYANTASYMGHDETLDHTDVTAIAALGTAIFQIPLPSILPADEPFWLGALGNHVLSVRINTQQNGMVATGSGTLSIAADGIYLLLECISVAESQYAELRKKWSNYAWDAEKWILNELPNQITTVATGESPKAKLDAFKDLPLERFFVYQLAGRNSPTSGAMFNWIAPADTALYHIEDQAGTKMFMTDKEYYKYNKVKLQNDQYANSAMKNTELTLITANPDLPSSRLLDKKTIFNFTGQENFVWTDFGANAGAMYVDMIGVQPVRYRIVDGVISRVY